MTQPARTPWERFSRDPRVASHAALRASDADRSVALDTLADAYADGRLDREEYDARLATVQAAKTLGELVAPVRDLAPDSAPADIREQALIGYRADLREAFFAFMVSSLITWAIWFGTAWHDGNLDPGFPWPIFISAVTLVNLLRVVANKQQILEQRRQRIQRRRRRELGR